jgi:CheY-like chemotaxis protein
MKSILIVDDIKVNLKVLEVLLTRNGYSTTSALSGKDALSLLQIKSIDLIISDILMPEMDGFQFCRLCKLDENLKHIPFIFYSSTHTEATARKLAQKVGAKAFITKPADPAMLLKTIESILDGHVPSPLEHKESVGDNEPLTEIQKTHNARQPRDQQAGWALLKNIPCAVWTVDAGGNITYISPAVEGITGFTMDHLLKTGKREWLTRVHPCHVEEVKSAYRDLYRNRIALDIEYRFDVLLNAKESLETDGFIEVILQNLSIEETEFISDIVLSPRHYTKTTIRDNGRGIEKAHLHRIFQPYFTTKTRDIPIIFITAMDNKAHRTKCFECGGVDYITKPFVANEVKKKIHTHLTPG